MNKIIVKQARKYKDQVDVFLISLQFVEELATVKSDFGEQFDNDSNISLRSLRILRRSRKGYHLIGDT